MIRLFEEMDAVEVAVPHEKKTLAKMLSRLLSEQQFVGTDFEVRLSHCTRHYQKQMIRNLFFVEFHQESEVE